MFLSSKTLHTFEILVYSFLFGNRENLFRELQQKKKAYNME